MRLTSLFVVFLLVCFLLLLSACITPVRNFGQKVQYSNVALNTSDNLTLAASYYASHSEKAVILLHTLGRSRGSWDKIAPELTHQFKVLSVDFRGHGKSDGEFVSMNDRDFQLLVLDVEAAVDYLRYLGVESSDVSIVGASIGANAALLYAADHPVDKLVLLSPGSVLRGLDISRLSYAKPMFVQVAHYDAYSSISVDNMKGYWSNARVEIYDASGHGTDLLTYDERARREFFEYLVS